MVETLTQWWQATLDVIGTTHPLLLFLALVVLPLAGVPTSPLWIAAGLRLGTWPAFVFCVGALVLNFTAGYWLARRGMRGPLTRWMERRGWRVPQLSDGDETLAILMLRVTPGIPLCVQNYLLGLAEVRFGRYLLLSLPAQAAYALAFVWLGNSLASSGVWRLALGVAALTGLVLLVSLLRRWLSRRASEAATVTTPLMKS